MTPPSKFDQAAATIGTAPETGKLPEAAESGAGPALPNTGPNTGPNSGPNSGPNTGPNAGPNAGPNTDPNTGPNSGPNTDPNTGPNSGDAMNCRAAGATSRCYAVPGFGGGAKARFSEFGRGGAAGHRSRTSQQDTAA